MRAQRLKQLKQSNQKLKIHCTNKKVTAILCPTAEQLVHGHSFWSSAQFEEVPCSDMLLDAWELKIRAAFHHMKENSSPESVTTQSTQVDRMPLGLAGLSTITLLSLPSIMSTEGIELWVDKIAMRGECLCKILRVLTPNFCLLI